MPFTSVFKFFWPSGDQSNDIEAHLKTIVGQMENTLLALQAQNDALFPWGMAMPLVRGPVPGNCIALLGQTLPQASYPKLASIYGVSSGNFTVDDMRGYGLRGWELNSGEQGGTVGSNQFTVTTDNMPVHDHAATVAIDDDHFHNPEAGYDYAISSPVGEQHFLYSIAQPNIIPPGVGNTNITFTRNEFNDQQITGTVDVLNSGGGQPVTFVPKSRKVTFITRAL
jgi:microcystin-dependent protein